MYAPLDFRFVIGPEPTITNLQQNKAATDRHGFARIKEQIRVHACQFVVEGYSLGRRKNGPQNFTSVSSRNLSLNPAPIEYAIQVSKGGGGQEGLLQTFTTPATWRKEVITFITQAVSAGEISEIWRLPKSRKIRKFD